MTACRPPPRNTAHNPTTTARHGAPNAIAVGITNETAEARLHILDREIAGTRSGLRTGPPVRDGHECVREGQFPDMTGAPADVGKQASKPLFTRRLPRTTSGRLG